MPVVLGAKPESTFAEPLGLLSDCHRRIEKFLGQIGAVAKAARGRALNEEERKVLDTALRYFRQASPLHTRDEEDSLFPRMRALNDPKVQEVLDTLETLEADHVAADAGHAEVDALGTKWLAGGALSDAESARLEEVVRTLSETYARHIAVEDKMVFPLAGQVLPKEAVSALGREMAERRGVDIDAPAPPLSRCVQRRLERQAAE